MATVPFPIYIADGGAPELASDAALEYALDDLRRIAKRAEGFADEVDCSPLVGPLTWNRLREMADALAGAAASMREAVGQLEARAAEARASAHHYTWLDEYTLRRTGVQRTAVTPYRAREVVHA